MPSCTIGYQAAPAEEPAREENQPPQKKWPSLNVLYLAIAVLVGAWIRSAWVTEYIQIFGRQVCGLCEP